MNVAESTHPWEPVTVKDWLDAYAAHAFERLGAYAARHGQTGATFDGLLRTAQAYALILDAPISRRAKWDLRATRRSLLGRIEELEQRANLRLAGETSAAEHSEILGTLAEYREMLAAVDLVLAGVAHDR
jgi:hypothetical protein